MENTDKEIIADTIQLCDKALRTRNKNDNFINGLREISIESVKSREYQILPDESVLYYKYHRTPEKLKQNGVLEYSWFPDSQNAYKEKSIGYHQVTFNYESAQKWIDKTINIQLKEQKQHVIIPEGKDHIYENNQLHIRLQNDTSISVDFSSSYVSRPCFEAIYLLYKNTNKTVFSPNEIRESYKKNTKEEIEWDRYTKIVSDIQKKINRLDLSKRIIFKFNTKLKAYTFKILPLPISSDS